MKLIAFVQFLLKLLYITHSIRGIRDVIYNLFRTRLRSWYCTLDWNSEVATDDARWNCKRTHDAQSVTSFLAEGSWVSVLKSSSAEQQESYLVKRSEVKWSKVKWGEYLREEKQLSPSLQGCSPTHLEYAAPDPSSSCKSVGIYKIIMVQYGIVVRLLVVRFWIFSRHGFIFYFFLFLIFWFLIFYFSGVWAGPATRKNRKWWHMSYSMHFVQLLPSPICAAAVRTTPCRREKIKIHPVYTWYI